MRSSYLHLRSSNLHLRVHVFSVRIFFSFSDSDRRQKNERIVALEILDARDYNLFRIVDLPLYFPPSLALPCLNAVREHEGKRFFI